MKTIITFSIFVLFCSPLLMAQTVHTVDNRPESGAQFTSLQAAIDAAAAGDIIYVHPSPTSYGSFIDLTKTLTLIGPGHDPSNSEGERASIGIIYFRPNSLNSVITGLSTGSINAQSFGTNTGNIHIINNRITGVVNGRGTDSPNWTIEGNYFDSAESSLNVELNGASDWIIQNNILEGVIKEPNRTTLITNNLFINADSGGGAEIFNQSSDITSPIVTNNMFIFTDPDVTTISYSGSTPIVYTNCLLWNSGEGATSDMAPLPGSGNLDNVDPLFNNIPSSLYNIYDNDYTLGAGSPAIGTATDGGDIGVFGRNFPFDIHGRPHSMPYPISMTILNTVVQPGQNLDVNFQAAQKN